jgi:hypothetical protein
MGGKLARLVKAARTPAVVDVKINWGNTDAALSPPAYAKSSAGDDFELVDAEDSPPSKPDTLVEKVGKLNLFAPDKPEEEEPTGPAKPKVVKPSDLPVEPVQQAPVVLRSLFSGMRYTVFAIIQAASLPEGIPTEIKITGKVQRSEQEVELVVPVTKATSFDAAPIHVLAGRKLIESAEDGVHSFGKDIADDPAALAAHLKAKIVSLGTIYGLSSSHTSFVAIGDFLAPEQLGAAKKPMALGKASLFSSFTAGPTPSGAWGSPRRSDRGGTFGAIPPPPPAPAIRGSPQPILSRMRASVFGAGGGGQEESSKKRKSAAAAGYNSGTPAPQGVPLPTAAAAAAPAQFSVGPAQAPSGLFGAFGGNPSGGYGQAPSASFGQPSSGFGQPPIPRLPRTCWLRWLGCRRSMAIGPCQTSCFDS